jgi:hypothetical protein
MNDIKPIEITQTITTIKGWACDKCDKTFEKEEAARNHRASHMYTHSDWIRGDSFYRFENEYDFTYWKRYGLYHHHGGCAGSWEGPGWYLIDWKGPEDNQYPSLEPATTILTLRLNNAEYEYRQAKETLAEFAKLAP